MFKKKKDATPEKNSETKTDSAEAKRTVKPKVSKDDKTTRKSREASGRHWQTFAVMLITILIGLLFYLQGN